MRFDFVLRNGRIIDGTGKPAFTADVAIAGDRIAAMGEIPAGQAARELDVSGFAVTPGFIDAHSHSDAYLLIEPDAPSKLSQGITTEVNGQCGGSAVPKLGAARLSSDWASMRYPTPEGGTAQGPTWSTVASYRRLFEQACPAINTIQFIGHNTLRAGVMGYEPKAADADETRAMCRNLEQALDEGGWGLSTGLLYQPGKYSTVEEVRALAKAAAAKGGMYATHMRSESVRLLEAVDEVLDLARATGVQIQISHLKTSGKANWHKIGPLLDKLDAARAEGINLHSDRYPYVAAGTELDVVFPDWAGAGGSAAELERLADPGQRARIVEEIDRQERDWDTVLVGGAWSETVAPFSGKTLAAAARTLGMSPGATVCLFVEKDLARTGGFFFGMSEENLHRIYEQPWVVCGSDASLRAPDGPLGADHPHPRAYGTMPRFFRMLTGRVDGFAKICSDEAAIRRMCGLPAEIFGIRDRGTIRVGAFADLAVLELESFRDAATYVQPHQYSGGVEMVFVNGALSYERGRFTGNRRGRFLTKG